MKAPAIFVTQAPVVPRSKTSTGDVAKIYSFSWPSRINPQPTNAEIPPLPAEICVLASAGVYMRKKRKIQLRLVDSRWIQNGIFFFRELRPASETASQNDQNKEANTRTETFKPWRIVAIRNWGGATRATPRFGGRLPTARRERACCAIHHTKNAHMSV